VTVFITGLPRDLQWKTLKQEFADAGSVIRADCQEDGSGKVIFENKADALWAIKNWSGKPFLSSKRIQIKIYTGVDKALKGEKKEKKERDPKKKRETEKKGAWLIVGLFGRTGCGPCPHCSTNTTSDLLLSS
jgi:RNA recognition motif-containing protein